MKNGKRMKWKYTIYWKGKNKIKNSQQKELEYFTKINDEVLREEEEFSRRQNRKIGKILLKRR